MSKAPYQSSTRLVRKNTVGSLSRLKGSLSERPFLNRSESSVFRMEASYSSTILFIWTLFLAFHAWHSNLQLGAATILVFSTVALTSEHGESRLLLPLLFLSESCLNHAMCYENSMQEFYASTLLSYLSLVTCKALRRGHSLQEPRLVAETILYAAVGLFMMYFIAKNKVISCAAVAFVVTGHIFFLKLLPRLGDNEATLVSGIVGFFIYDVCVNNNLSTNGKFVSIFSFTSTGFTTTHAHVASRGMVLAAIYLLASISLLSKLFMVPISKNSKSSERRVSQTCITTLFVVSFILVGVIMFAALSYQFQENFFVWLYAYITASWFRRITLLAWLGFIPATVLCIDLFTRKLRRTVRRKMFHFIAVVAFTPVAVIDPTFLAFAIATATSFVVVMEVARFYGVYGTKYLARFMSHYIDERDNVDDVVRTHIYLIFGLGASLIIHYRHHYEETYRAVPTILELSIGVIPGILSLGVVDSSAAIIGSTVMWGSRRNLGRYLKNKLFTERANVSITHKTTTGTFGGLICGVLFWAVILVIAGTPLGGPVWCTFFMIVVCTLTECFLDSIDNLQMPFVVLGAVYNLFSILLPNTKMWKIPFIGCPSSPLPEVPSAT